MTSAFVGPVVCSSRIIISDAHTLYIHGVGDLGQISEPSGPRADARVRILISSAPNSKL